MKKSLNKVGRTTVVWRVFCFMLLLTLVTSHILSGISAKYFTQNEQEGQLGSVTAWNIVVNYTGTADNTLNFDSNTSYGDPGSLRVSLKASPSISFSVQNCTGDIANQPTNICEVAVSYTVVLYLPKELSGGITPQIDGTNMTQDPSDPTRYTCNTGTMNLAAGIATEKKHELTFHIDRQVFYDSAYETIFDKNQNNAFNADEFYVIYGQEPTSELDKNIYGDYLIEGIKIGVVATQID